ncbi:MAG: 30S ribosomal protein S16 [Spirochaeta sp. LUC14_002_19_P3]|nr:MAG: 30S ribosomal protein S16 [Spirochaeta sp. LUC14_002_19_P3]
MSVKIRLKRMGAKKRPYYRVVVMDSRKPRDGRTIDEVGVYHPIEAEARQFMVKEEKVREWLKVGARPTPTVKRLLNRKSITIS